MLKAFNFIFLNLKFIYLFFILFLIFLFYFRKKTLTILNLKKIRLLLIFLLLMISFLQTFMTYFLWKNDPISKNLLPPIQPIIYFLRYSFQHYFFEVVLTIIFSYLIFLLVFWFNKKFQEIFFYDEEPYFASLGVLLTGWPGCLSYLCLVLFLGVVSHLFLILINKILVKRNRNLSLTNTQFLSENNIPEENLRLSLCYFWFPSALLVLILSDIINKWLIFQYLKV